MNKLPAYIIYNSPVAATKTYAEKLKVECVKYGFDAELFDGIWKTEAESFLQERGIILNKQWVKDSEWYQERNQVKDLLEAFETTGHQGCFASHYLLWEKCIKLDIPICIFEYDVQIMRQLPVDILNRFTDAIEICATLKSKEYKRGKVKINIPTTTNETKEISVDEDSLRVIELEFEYIDYPYPHFSRSGSSGYIIKPAGAKKLIRTAIEKGYLGTDTFLNRDWIDYKKLVPSIANNFLDFSVQESKKG